MIILYADDIAEGSDTVGRLQFMINVLVEYCRMWSLIVNLCKTKIVVFRRGKLKRSEKWYFNGKKIDVVSSYKYLGIIFSTKLKWTLAKKTLAAQARKAIGLIFRYHYQCGYLPVGVAKILFDKMITPILLYGCEVWGWEYCDQIENVQFYFYKRILGLGSHTSHTAVTDELGIYPLAVMHYKRCVKYLKDVKNILKKFLVIDYHMLVMEC